MQVGQIELAPPKRSESVKQLYSRTRKIEHLEDTLGRGLWVAGRLKWVPYPQIGAGMVTVKWRGQLYRLV